MGTDQVIGQRIRRASTLALVLAIGAVGTASAQDASPTANASPALVMASAIPGASGGAPREVVRTETGAIDACALLTSAQIEAVIGSPVVETTPYGDRECRWTVGPLAAFPGRDAPWIDASFYENDLLMLQVAASAGPDGVTAIEGLGDRAFRTSQGSHLWVQHGQDVVAIVSGLPGVSDDSDASRIASDAIEVLFARLILDQL